MTAIIGVGGSQLERDVDQTQREKLVALLLGEIELAVNKARFDLECGDDAERLKRAVKEVKHKANKALQLLDGLSL